MNQLKMYSTNTTDNQWQVIEKNINVQERKKILAYGQYRRTMVQLETVFYSHIPDKPCIRSSNLPVRYTNFPAHTFLQQ